MTDPATAAQRARHLLDIGRLDEARTTLAQGLAAQPSDPTLHLLMARAHHEAGEPAEALAAAERSIALEVNPVALQLAGASHRALGDYGAALASYDRAIAVEPEGARYHVGRALTLVAPFVDADETAEPADLADAVRSCGIAAGLDAELAVVPYTRGLIAMVEGDLPGAAHHLERSLELDPEFADGHRLLGTVRARQGMSRLASRHLAAAGRLDPTDHQPLSLLRRLARPLSRRARRRGELDTDHMVPAARRILEADLRLRDPRSMEG